MQRTLVFWYLSGVLLAGLVTACASTPAEARAPEVGWDPAVRVGRLTNGFTYLVRSNRKPENRAHLSLVVRFGSLHEADDERGWAHLIEHLAFNGTERFRKQEIVHYFERIGMRFGDGINAYTSFEETVYFLEIPMDDPAILETSFQILEDWSRALSFDPEEVEKEKGVIEEEWRLGRDVNGRRRDVILPVLFNHSRYANRLPIGTMETVRAATPERLRALYRRWYRPERMALVAVGDFDADRIVQRVRQGFESWRNPTPAPVEPEAPIRAYEGRRFAFFTDPEQAYNIVQLARLEAAHPLPFAQQRRREVLTQMLKNALDQRLNLLTQSENPPYLSAFFDWSNFARRFWVSSLYVVSDPGNQAGALEAALREVERLKRFGFTPRELEREKSAVEQDLQLLEAREQDRTHGEWANDLADAFLNDQPVPALPIFASQTRSILETLGLEEWNRWAAAQFDWDHSRVFVLTNGSAGRPPSEESLEALIRQASTWQFDRFQMGTIDRLVPEDPAPQAIVETRTWPELGLTRWTLPNGAQVYHKRTDFKSEEVLVRAFRLGGLGLATDTELLQAAWTTDLLSESNLGPWSHAQLLDYLADKQISLEMSADEAAVWITGSAAARHLDVWVQFLYLRLTQIAPTPTTFRSVQARMRAMAESRQNNPELRFQDFLTTLLRGGPARSRVLSPEAVQSAQLDQVLAWDRRLFGSGNGWVFVFVGDFDPDRLEGLVRTYLANIPDRGRETPQDREARPTARGPQILRAGQERRASVFLVYPYQAELSIQDLVTAQGLVEILNIRLREKIREELGGTYSIRFDFQYRPLPTPNGFAFVQFGTDPGRYQDIVRKVRQEIEALLREGVSAEEVQVFRQIRTRELEQAQRQNSFWVSNLSSYVYGGRDLALLPRFLERVQAVTPDMVRAVGRRLIAPDRGFEAVLLPQNP